MMAMMKNKSSYTAIDRQNRIVSSIELVVPGEEDTTEGTNNIGGTNNTNNAQSSSSSSSSSLPRHVISSTSSTSTSTSTSSSNLLKEEATISLKLFLDAKLNLLFLFGPVAFLGSTFSLLSEAPCFLLAGIALIPCAERLSFITEQVAEHTNDTFGALLNATFGNAPEFLISAAALRSGFYRVVQLTLLGSMLTNLLFVFGLSCLVGGFRWQVQELRITSGNVSIGMLLLSTMGLVLPASLKLGNDIEATSMRSNSHSNSNSNSGNDVDVHSTPEMTAADVSFSRINALVMVTAYVLYLIFQLGSHKEEFDYDGDDYAAFGGGHNIVRTSHYNNAGNGNVNAGNGNGNGNGDPRQPNAASNHPPKKPITTRKNMFCRRYCFFMRYCPEVNEHEREREPVVDLEMEPLPLYDHDHDHDLEQDFQDGRDHGTDIQINRKDRNHNGGVSSRTNALKRTAAATAATNAAPQSQPLHSSSLMLSMSSDRNHNHNHNHNTLNAAAGVNGNHGGVHEDGNVHGSLKEDAFQINPLNNHIKKSLSDRGDDMDEEGILNSSHPRTPPPTNEIMSMRMGLLWLAFVTLAISILSDIIVETIDGFAARSKMTEVFTSVIIIPYFSNIAEQVSAVIFAYKNKMDLCIGVSVGSAIQIGQFVMPGCVLVGWWMDKDMTLYFRGYETICLLLGVLCMAAVLQGGTTNWLVGVFFVGVYIMIGAGFAFHEDEDLASTGGSD